MGKLTHWGSMFMRYLGFLGIRFLFVLGFAYFCIVPVLVTAILLVMYAWLPLLITLGGLAFAGLCRELTRGKEVA